MCLNCSVETGDHFGIPIVRKITLNTKINLMISCCTALYHSIIIHWPITYIHVIGDCTMFATIPKIQILQTNFLCSIYGNINVETMLSTNQQSISALCTATFLYMEMLRHATVFTAI